MSTITEMIHLQYVVDYSALLPLTSQELSTPGTALGPISKPVARIITKMIAAQDNVSFSAVMASSSSSALALRLLTSCTEFKLRTKRLILSSPRLPASFAKHLQESTATASITVLGNTDDNSRRVLNTMFPRAVHLDPAVKDMAGLVNDIPIEDNPNSSGDDKVRSYHPSYLSLPSSEAFPLSYSFGAYITLRHIMLITALLFS